MIPATSNRSLSNNNIVTASKKGAMVRSHSQEVSLIPIESVIRPKAYSDTSLDHPIKHKPLIQKTIKEQPSINLEDEVYSTDSSVIDEESRKKKRKLFPGFSKKGKTKGD